MTYKIEKGLPIPQSPTGIKTHEYPFADMEVGDSFFVEDIGKRSSVSSAAVSFAGRQAGYGKTFRASIRRDGTGLRVWRVA